MNFIFLNYIPDLIYFHVPLGFDTRIFDTRISINMYEAILFLSLIYSYFS